MKPSTILRNVSSVETTESSHSILNVRLIALKSASLPAKLFRFASILQMIQLKVIHSSLFTWYSSSLPVLYKQPDARVGYGICAPFACRPFRTVLFIFLPETDLDLAVPA